MEALNLTPVDYTALIQEKLAFIPADYEELQGYALHFKKALKTVLQQGMHLKLQYQMLENELVLIEVTPTEQESLEELTQTHIDFELLLTENETTLTTILESVEKEPVMLFSEDSIILCKTNNPTQWTQESAQADVRTVVGTLINHLPTQPQNGFV
jgi:hypothetical protein